MAIPPIVSNFPALNAYKSDKAPQSDGARASDGPATEDLVEISSAAVEKLETAQRAEDDAQAQEISRQSRAIIEGDTSISLTDENSFLN